MLNQRKTYERVESLDWLRGLMALSIMLYNLISWVYSQHDATTFIGRMGIYGVSIFFILSGLSMSIVYQSSLNSLNKLIVFFIKRLFRIIPLLFIVTTCTMFYNIYVLDQIFNLKQYLLNITTLFGFVDYSSYIATGAWSIGNEMVYYALTPIFLWIFNKNLWMGNICFFVTILKRLTKYYFKC